jgi:hypothetical protein
MDDLLDLFGGAPAWNNQVRALQSRGRGGY